MKTQSLIIDCDPGVDDAVALLLAFASPEFDLLAVTTVGGNVAADLTARNARIVRQIAGREDTPVFRGAEKPLRRLPSAAGDFHGEDGLGDLTPFEPEAGLAFGASAEAIVAHAMARPERSVAVAVLGPLTNLALAMRLEPRLAAHLGPVVVMGGARSEGGNITASAEFNIWADPDAAAEVLASGCEVVMLGLDATHQVRPDEAVIERMAALDNPRAALAARMLRFSNEVERTVVGGESAPLHDPCIIAWLLRPELFRLRPCRIEVETESDLTRGHTAVEFRVPDDAAPHRWAVAANAPAILDLLTERLA